MAAKPQSGIDRSRLNALKHGAFAKSLLLNNESPILFAKLRDEYFAYLRPANPVERDLVEQMIIASMALPPLLAHRSQHRQPQNG